MKKKFVLTILILFFFSSGVLGQKNKLSVREYYNCIQKAEHHITYRRYFEAGKYYQKAFLIKYPNDKDLYNAFLSTYYESDTILAKEYINQLAYKGLPKGYFKDTLQNIGFYKYISTGYDSCYASGSKDTVAMHWKQLASIIYEEDKRIRIETDILPEDKAWEKIDKIDSGNIQKLKKYIMQNGFPSFEKKGFWDRDSDDPFDMDVVWLVLWHTRFQTSDIDSLMWQAVLKGDFRPDDWGSIIADKGRYDSINYHMKIWKDQTKLSQKEKDKINKWRASIYLENYDQYKQNWEFAHKNKERLESEFNPNLFSPNENIREQFIFYNSFLLPSRQQIELGN